MTDAVLAPMCVDSADLRNQVEIFLHRYAHTIDDGDLEKWPDFFQEDGIYHILTRESFEANHSLGVMYCQGQGMMQDRVLALNTANIFEPHTYCHILGGTELNSFDENLVEARTNFQVLRTMQGRETTLFAAGKYLDSIAIQNNRMLFRERKVILESRQIDILLVYPL